MILMIFQLANRHHKECTFGNTKFFALFSPVHCTGGKLLCIKANPVNLFHLFCVELFCTAVILLIDGDDYVAQAGAIFLHWVIQ